MRKYWDPKFHTWAPLEHWCTLQTARDLTLRSQQICWQGTVLPHPGGIGLASKPSWGTYKVHKTLVYGSQRTKLQPWWDMWILAICLTRIKPDHRLVLSFSVVVQPFPSGLWNRPWLPHRPTTQRELLCMRLHENVLGCDEWSITSRSHVVWTSPTPPPLSMKIMWLVLHRCAWIMSGAISRSIFALRFFYPPWAPKERGDKYPASKCWYLGTQ